MAVTKSREGVMIHLQFYDTRFEISHFQAVLPTKPYNRRFSCRTNPTSLLNSYYLFGRFDIEDIVVTRHRQCYFKSISIDNDRVYRGGKGSYVHLSRHLVQSSATAGGQKIKFVI